MAKTRDIYKRYPELRPPGPRYWIVPVAIVCLAVLALNVNDTELAKLTRNRGGQLTIQFPEYRWNQGLNILIGVNRQVTRVVDGERVPVTETVEGREVPVMRRQGGLIRPDMSRYTMKLLIPNMIETIEMALLGTLGAFLLAFPLSFLAARNIVGTGPASLAIYGIIRFVFNFTSAIPTLIMALLFTVIAGLGPAAGVLALGFNSIGMLGRMFAEALEGVDKGPIEALQATGAGRIQTVAFGVIPQIGPLFLAYSVYRWDINVRMSMILGFVGAGGIGVFLQQYINNFNYPKVSTAFLLILLTVTLLDWGNSWIQRKVL